MLLETFISWKLFYRNNLPSDLVRVLSHNFPFRVRAHFDFFEWWRNNQSSSTNQCFLRLWLVTYSSHDEKWVKRGSPYSRPCKQSPTSVVSSAYTDTNPLGIVVMAWIGHLLDPLPIKWQISTRRTNHNRTSIFYALKWLDLILKQRYCSINFKRLESLQVRDPAIINSTKNIGVLKKISVSDTVHRFTEN